MILIYDDLWYLNGYVSYCHLSPLRRPNSTEEVCVKHPDYATSTPGAVTAPVVRLSVKMSGPCQMFTGKELNHMKDVKFIASGHLGEKKSPEALNFRSFAGFRFPKVGCLKSVMIEDLPLFVFNMWEVWGWFSLHMMKHIFTSSQQSISVIKSPTISLRNLAAFYLGSCGTATNIPEPGDHCLATLQNLSHSICLPKFVFVGSVKTTFFHLCVI